MGPETTRYLDRLVLGQAADAAEQRLEILAIDLADVEDATDIAGRDLQRRALYARRAGGETGGNLDGSPLALTNARAYHVHIDVHKEAHCGQATFDRRGS